MQSKTSFFNKTAFRKNLTRFAPVWGCYTLGLLTALVMMLVNAGAERTYWPVYHMGEMITLMGAVNLGYALLTAQLLFGDLYTARSCYALHALPLKRETWYGTNLLSGLLFSLAPTFVMTLFALPLAMGSCVSGGWKIPLLLFLTANMQYLCFFGIAVLASLCAGNRLGMVAIYGILNLFALLLAAAVRSIFEPMYFGVELDLAPLGNWCPLAHFSQNPVVQLGYYPREYDLWVEAGSVGVFSMDFTLTEGWFRYYGNASLAGLLFMGLGLLLYKKRDLECAGDFLAFRSLEPVVGVVFAVTAALMARLTFENFSPGVPDYYLSLAFGLILGWFLVRMLMERTTRVFKKKNFLGAAILTAAAALVIGIGWLDPLGLEDWIPEAEDVRSVQFGNWAGWTESEEPGDIEAAIQLHKMGLAARIDETREGGHVYGGRSEEDARPEDMRYGVQLNITYTMKKGNAVNRHYIVWADSQPGQMLKGYLSRSNGYVYDRLDAEERLDPANLLYITVNGSRLDKDLITEENALSLLAAIEADCRQGYLAQNGGYHTGYFEYPQDEYSDEVRQEDTLYISMSSGEDREQRGWFSVDIFTDCPNTMQWLRDRNVLEDLGITVVETDYPFVYGYEYTNELVD